MFAKVTSNPLYTKINEWVKLIGITGSAQVGVQAIGLLCGILVIRVLPTTEYAYYTIANTMLGTIVMLANAGIPTGVMSQGGKVWKDKEKLGEVVNTGFDLRKKFIIGTNKQTKPKNPKKHTENQASWLTTGLLCVVLIPSIFSSLNSSLLEIAPKLRQDIVPLQKIQVIVNLVRLLLIIPILLLMPYAILALLPIGISQIWGNVKLKKLMAKYVVINKKTNEEVRKQILKTVRRLLPVSIYYSISGQITIWLLSIFGSTTSLAQMGALGRVAMLVNLVAIVCTTLVTPRFARLPNTQKVIFKRFFQASLFAFLILCLLVIGVYLFPKQILWILGSNYAGLNYEILLAVIGSCLYTFGIIIFSLYSSRGWVLNPGISIPISILVLIVAIWLTDVSTLQGVLLLNVIVSGLNLLIHFTYGMIKINSMKKVQIKRPLT